jgi:hypothetical protein
MQRSVVDPEALGEHYIICICEGAAEETIMNALLDADQLIFSRKQLVEEKITRMRKASEIQTTFLRRDYEKTVDIVRILDSETDRFRLGKLYVSRFQVYNVYTKPEIEMLLILSEKKYEAFKKSRKMPSKYCLEDLFPGENVKGKAFLQKYFQDTERLLRAIDAYRQVGTAPHGEAILFDLLK